MLVTATEPSSLFCVFELVGSVTTGFSNLAQVWLTSGSGIGLISLEKQELEINSSF